MNPTFGDKVEGAHYQTRYGVYAVIPNQEKTKIILVQAPNGAWFLPGGEIEATVTPTITIQPIFMKL